MNRNGRVSILAILAVLGVLIIAGLAFFSTESPTSATAKFLGALQERNVDKLVDLSYVPKGYEGSLRKQWDYTVNVATPRYMFQYKVTSHIITGDQAMVKVRIVANADKQGAFDDPVDIKLVKVGKKWKVDLYELPRKVYPALPRRDDALARKQS